MFGHTGLSTAVIRRPCNTAHLERHGTISGHQKPLASGVRLRHGQQMQVRHVADIDEAEPQAGRVRIQGLRFEVPERVMFKW